LVNLSRGDGPRGRHPNRRLAVRRLEAEGGHL
jgi:hypothetical protein